MPNKLNRKVFIKIEFSYEDGSTVEETRKLEALSLLTETFQLKIPLTMTKDERQKLLRKLSKSFHKVVWRVCVCPLFLSAVQKNARQKNQQK